MIREFGKFISYLIAPLPSRGEGWVRGVIAPIDPPAFGMTSNARYFRILPVSRKSIDMDQHFIHVV